jgi:hypothetical protein
VAGGARGLSDLSLDRDGAQLFAGAGAAVLPVLEEWYGGAPRAPSTRIAQLGALAPFLTGAGPLAALASRSLEANWALGWHQDRTIAVATRAEVEGFGP